MKKNLFILFLQLSATLVSGQAEKCNLIIDQRYLFEAPLTGQFYQMKETNGSQLFMDIPFTGDIILNSGDTVRNKLIAYNGYEDELIWSESGTLSMIKIDRRLVEKFFLYNSRTRQPIEFRHLRGITTGDRQIDNFAQVLVDDTLSLYVTHLIHIIEKTEHATDEYVTYIDRIEPKPPLYYFGLPGNNFLSIKNPGIRALYNIFPDYKMEIKALLTKYHVTVRNESDLIRIIKLINENGIIK
jgi:hypothetical protein